MARPGYVIEEAVAADFPEVTRLLWEFEDVVDTKLNLRKLIAGAETESCILEDCIERKAFRCLLAKSETGDSIGITVSTSDSLAGIGPILLLTIIYIRERGKGLGRAILEQTIKDADKKVNGGIRQVHFMFNRDNHWAWEFYKRFNTRNLTLDADFLVLQFGLVCDMPCSADVWVRPAVHQDRTHVVEMLKELQETHHVPLWTAENNLEESNFLLDNVYVAQDLRKDDSSEILGLVSFYLRYSVVSRRTPFVAGILVKEGHRRSGIGTALLNHLSQKWTTEEGCTSANTIVLGEESSSGQRFFSRYPELINRTAEDTWNYCVFDRHSGL